MSNAAADFLEGSRHEILGANVLSIEIAKRNLRANIANAKQFFDRTDATDAALDRLRRDGDVLLAELARLSPNQANVLKQKRAFETTLNAAIEAVTNAKPSATARALGLA